VLVVTTPWDTPVTGFATVGAVSVATSEAALYAVVHVP
jgi:hypothetical protein